jgi:hypothetical protein
MIERNGIVFHDQGKFIMGALFGDYTGPAARRLLLWTANEEAAAQIRDELRVTPQSLANAPREVRVELERIFADARKGS